MKKIILLILLVLSMNLFTQVKVFFGEGKNEIGIDIGEFETWKPLFFSVDSSSNLHIPDFYKNRIAIFNTSSTLLKEIDLDKGISPRMNYFNLNYNNTYTTYDNYTLFLLSDKGEIIWKFFFGIGEIPTHVFCDDRGVFVSFNNKEYIYFSYHNGIPVGLINSILIEEDKVIDNAMLLYQDKEKNVWITNEEHKKVVFNYYNPKVLIKLVESNSVSGTGFWIARGLNNKYYSLKFESKFLELVEIQE